MALLYAAVRAFSATDAFLPALRLSVEFTTEVVMLFAADAASCSIFFRLSLAAFSSALILAASSFCAALMRAASACSSAFRRAAS